MSDLVVWTGPVNLQQAAGATVPGAVEKAFPCVGAQGTPLCSSFAWSLRDAAGRRLPALAQKCGLRLDDVDDVFLGAFSAGGGVLREIWSNVEDRRRLRYCHSADATYSSWNAGKTAPIINEWVIQWGVDVATGDGSQLWTATASPSPNYGAPTGVETLREIRRQIELRTGREFQRLSSFYGIEPAPEAAYKLGNVIFAEYALEPLFHGHHADQLAAKVWQGIMQPWLAELRRGGGGVVTPPPGGQPAGASEELPWWAAAAFAAGGLAAYLLWRWYRDE